MKYIKEELENLIFKENKSYREIGRIYNVSDTYVKKICRRLNIDLPIRSKFSQEFKPHNTGTKKKYSCINCGRECNQWAKKYCSVKCQILKEKENLYKDFLNNNEQYCRANYQPKALKPFILDEQNHQCAICNMKDNWNNKLIIFVLDHIDGNAANNKRENLRLVCPNCDSQLDTYKSKNKNSARKERYIKNYKNI